MGSLSVFVLHAIMLCCASFSLSLSTPPTSDSQTDKLALQAFKSQLTESSQKTLSSWNDSLHVCEWQGVGCGRRHRRVTILDIRSKGLEGQISPYVGNLPFLRRLELYNNSFHGNIPPQLGKLSRLKMLGLNMNSLAGEIPVNISLCSNLVDFSALRNNLVGNIPTELGFLSKLVTLRLEDNKLSGGLPSSLGNLTSLQNLTLSGNSLGGSIPSTMNQMKAIKLIGLEECELSGTLPPFDNLTTLEVFSLYNNRLSGTLPTQIGFTLPNLKRFLIAENQFSGHIPISMFNISGINDIDLSYNQFIGNVPPLKGNLINLTRLLLAGNNLGSGKHGDLEFITSLTSCRNLEVLTLSRNQFRGMIPSTVANFSNKLNKFFLNKNQISGNIPIGIVNARGLTLLMLQSNFITGAIPVGIGNLPNLELLDLSKNQLSGQIPSSISHMSQLSVLDLSDNNLEGGTTSALGNQYLQILDLSNNNLTGSIRKQDIGASPRLRELYLDRNSINGSLPLEVDHFEYLEVLDVSHNKMSGEIPFSIGSCSRLTNLYIEGNLFIGSIPSSFSLLKGLEDLDISNNNISGQIPTELEKLSSLRHLNLSYNNLEGEVPKGGVFGNATAFSVVGNDHVCGDNSKLGLRECQIVKAKKKGTSLAFKVVLGVLLPSFVLLLMFVLYLWRKPKATSPSDLYVGDHRRVSYHDLHRATDGFSPSNLIGRGRYGSVYKGILQQDEGPSAIKVLNLMERGASKSFIAECETLREVRHRNLLKILTVCSSMDFSGNDFKALVFELMPNGSLENWLHPSPNGGPVTRRLSLRQRVDIAFDVAAALNYLHNDCDKPIVHCDLKPSNVLLSEDMTAHVGDFGLAKFLFKNANISLETETNSVAIRGTIGYIPPEYGMGLEVSTEGDVYSYGILLLEMLTGKKPTDELFKDGSSLHEFCKAMLPLRAKDIIDMDLSLEDTYNESASSADRIDECLNAVVGVGVACSVETANARVDIKHVLKEMHSVKQVLSLISEINTTC